MATAVQTRHRANPMDQVGDRVARLGTLAFAALIVLAGMLIVYVLWGDSGPARVKLGWGFLVSTQWNPVTEQFGGLPFIYGTVITSVVALLISIPLGEGSAIFLSELAPIR